MSRCFLVLTAGLLAMGCGGAKTRAPAALGSGKQATVAPSEWAAWQEWTKVSTKPFYSKDHGKRLVEIYINDVGLEAYKNEDAPMPVGSIVIKPSWVNEDGAAGAEGPLFVMKKMPKGFSEDPDSGDWFYALEWKAPPPEWQKKLGGDNVLWTSPSDKVQYCLDCHDTYDRQLGMPSKSARAW